MLVAALWCCTWGRGREGAMAPAPLSAGFQSPPLLPTIKLGPSGAGSRVDGLVHALGPHGSLQQPLLWGWEFLLLLPQAPRCFHSEVWGFISPCWSPGLHSLLRSLPFMPFYLCANVGPQGLLPAALPALFSATLSPALSVYLCTNVGPQGLLVVRLPALFVLYSTSLGPTTAKRVLSTPPTGLDECFFFYLLGVGLPCRSIFCQFWLCEEAQCVYLHRHLGSPILKFIYL